MLLYHLLTRMSRLGGKDKSIAEGEYTRWRTSFFQTFSSTACSSSSSKYNRVEKILLLSMERWSYRCLFWWKIAATMRTMVRVVIWYSIVCSKEKNV